MAIAIQAVPHPLLGRAVKEIFAHLQDFEVLPSVLNEAEAMGQRISSSAFLLTGVLKTDLSASALPRPLVRQQVSSPSSKQQFCRED